MWHYCSTYNPYGYIQLFCIQFLGTSPPVILAISGCERISWKTNAPAIIKIKPRIKLSIFLTPNFCRYSINKVSINVIRTPQIDRSRTRVSDLMPFRVLPPICSNDGYFCQNIKNKIKIPGIYCFINLCQIFFFTIPSLADKLCNTKAIRLESKSTNNSL